MASKPQRSSPRVRFPVAVGSALVSAMLFFAAAPPASAAGYARIDRYILKQPVSGWQSLTKARLDMVNNILQGTENAVGHTYGWRIRTAVEGWHAPNSQQDTLTIIVLGFALPKNKRGLILRALRAGVTRAASELCGASKPRSDVAYAAIPGARQVTCRAASDGLSTTGIIFKRSNLVTYVVSASLPVAALQGISSQQYRALPNKPTSITR